MWVIVGASTDGGTIDDVRSDGRRVGFVLTPAADDTEYADSVAVRVWGGEDYASVGGTPLPQDPGPPDPESGELVRRHDSTPAPVEAEVRPGASVEILVRHVGGSWLSLTHMAFDVPPVGR